MITRHPHPRVADDSEFDTRVDWWLREHGHFPTHAALLAIREHNADERADRRLAHHPTERTDAA